MSNTTITPDMLLAQMRSMAAQAQGAQTQGIQANQETVNGQSDFADLLKQSINEVNNTSQEAKQLTDAFQQGDPNVQLSEVMIAMQKSSVSFEAMLQVRNKLVSAYQEIMNMQV